MNIYMLLALLGLPLSAFAGWDGRILEVRSKVEVSGAELAANLATARIVVLGEKHNTPAVQLAQARIIREAVEASAARGRFTTAWEFLDATSQAATDEAFSRFRAGTLDARGFLRATQGNDKNASYVPILEATRELGGRLLGVNLSREQKAPVVQHGIAAADPALVPPGFAMGGDAYRERFADAMGGHATPEQLENYFAAQCLTDDVMAYQLLADSDAALRFLVAGSFHTDYFDATVARLRARAPGQPLRLVRLVDASDYLESELPALLEDPSYGDVADYVFFVNEPATEGTLK